MAISKWTEGATMEEGGMEEGRNRNESGQGSAHGAPHDAIAVPTTHID